MTIRRAVVFAALLGLGLLTGVAQGQVVQWVNEPATVGTHQLPSSASCTLPGNILSPAPACVTLNQAYNQATMTLSTNPGVLPTWSFSGKMPTGLGIAAGPSFSSPISGTPTVAGVYSFVITVCSKEAAESCPIFPGRAQRLHWPFPDPSTFTGTDDQIMSRVREVRDAIRDQVRSFVEEKRGA